MFYFLLKLANKYKVYIKYLISGGTATFIDLFLLFIFHSIFDISIVPAATLAFLMAFFVSFYLQKFWTFRDNSKEKIGKQGILYFIVAAANLGVNAIGMYFLAEVLHVWYLLAQIIMCGAIAFYSFLIYNFLIFNKTEKGNVG